MREVACEEPIASMLLSVALRAIKIIGDIQCFDVIYELCLNVYCP